MGMFTKVTGNLLQNPEQRMVRVKGEDRKITDLRVFADYYRRDGNGELVQDDDKCIAVEVTIWNEKLGDAVMEHFRKGARVVVDGEMHVNNYVDKEDTDRFSLRVDAETAALVPYRIEKIVFRAKRQEPADGVPA